MRILAPRSCAATTGRLLNIHPSLLPAFPGLHTHRRALEAGCKLAGATVHFVTAATRPRPDRDAGGRAGAARRRRGRAGGARAGARARDLPAAVRWFVRASCASTAASCATPTASRNCCSEARDASRTPCSTWRPNCCARCCSFDAPADARRLDVLPRSTATLGAARAPHAGRDRLRRAAPAAAVPAPGASRQRRRSSGAWRSLGWQGERHASCARALEPHEQQWLAQVQAIDRADAARQAAPQPARLAGRSRCRRSSATTSSGRWRQACDEPAPLDLRVNTLKAKREDGAARRWPRPASRRAPTPYSPWGLRVARQAGAARSSTSFTRGDVEVQDEGSQLLALLTDAKRGEMVVDFCAGAGGKTLALGAAMRNTGRLYAFDVSGHRLDALKPRLARSGLSNVYPVQIAHERDERIKRLAGKIDRVLVDAPCSGLGTLAPQSRPEVAPVAAGGAGTAGQAGGDPGQRGAPAEAGRTAGLRHLQPAASRKRGRRARRSSAAHPEFEPLPVAASSGRGPRRRRGRTGAGRHVCACGRIGTARTASSRRSGNVAD